MGNAITFVFDKTTTALSTAIAKVNCFDHTLDSGNRVQRILDVLLGTIYFFKAQRRAKIQGCRLHEHSGAVTHCIVSVVLFKPFLLCAANGKKRKDVSADVNWNFSVPLGSGLFAAHH